MKKPLTYINKVCMAALLMLTAACELHTSNNGDLDGLWQLTQMDTLSTGRSADMKSTRIFWAVQADLLEMKDLSTDQTYIPIFFRFRHQGDTLVLSEPIADLRYISPESPDSIITSPATLHFYGIRQLRDTLHVLRLDSEKLTLQSRHYRLYFRKY